MSSKMMLTQGIGQVDEKIESQVLASEDRKCFRHLKHRLRVDKEFYLQKKFYLEKELDYLKRQLKILRNEGREAGESMNRISHFYKRMREELDV